MSDQFNVQADLSRHDHHRIEIKSVIDLIEEDIIQAHQNADATRQSSISDPSTTPPFNTESDQNSIFMCSMDVFLFFPKSLHLPSWDKSSIISDFHSHVRLSIPTTKTGSQAVLEDALRHLSSARARYNNFETSVPLYEELTHYTKELAAVLSEILKRYRSDHSKALLSLQEQTSDDRATIHRLTQEIRNVQATIESVRSSLGPSKESLPAILSYFDEFISSLYIQYLSKLNQGVQRIEKNQFREELQNLMYNLQTHEAEHRRKCGYHSSTSPLSAEDSSDKNRLIENELIRLSQLKKFFQSSLFFDVTYKDAAKAYTQPVAAGAAALAAIWAIVFQQMNTPGAMDFGLKGVSFISISVVAYVLKDRIKEWAKTTFAQKATHILADVQQHLFANRNKIGAIQEWFRVFTKKDMPDFANDILDLRHRYCVTEVEKNLPEDVLHYRRLITLKTKSLHALHNELTPSRSRWGIRDNLRINLERHLKYMDDPFKDMSILEHDGRISKQGAHRVYHCYACVRISYMTQPMWTRHLFWGRRLFLKDKSMESETAKSQNYWQKFFGLYYDSPLGLKSVRTQIYRIVLDKTGVDRVESCK